MLPELSPVLIELYKVKIRKGKMHLSARRGIISLLEKTGRDARYLANWHPLSLLNCNYQFFSKLLATRLSTVLLRSYIHHSMVQGSQWTLAKKSTLKKHPSREKSTFLAKKAPISQTKSTFGAEKKHLVNIILSTKSNNDGEKKFYFHPNFF